MIENNQNGAVLVVSLIMLLLLTLIGVTAMRTTTLEEKMAGNMRDRQLAFQAGEAALRAGEAWMTTQTSPPSPVSLPCTTPPCTYDASSFSSLSIENMNDTWWATNGTEFGLAGTKEMPGVIGDPQYVTEFLQYISDDLLRGHTYGEGTGRSFYRFTSIGHGGTTAPRIVIQSTFAKRFN